MVDTACGEIIGLEGVEGAILGETNAGGIVGVFQQPRFRKNRVNLIVLVHIEVASDEHGGALGNLTNLGHHQFG